MVSKRLGRQGYGHFSSIRGLTFNWEGHFPTCNTMSANIIAQIPFHLTSGTLILPLMVALHSHQVY